MRPYFLREVPSILLAAVSIAAILSAGVALGYLIASMLAGVWI